MKTIRRIAKYGTWTKNGWYLFEVVMVIIVSVMIYNLGSYFVSVL